MALINQLTAIGNAIRYKTGSNALLTLSEMPAAIKSISGSGTEYVETDQTFKDYVQGNLSIVKSSDLKGITEIADYAFYKCTSLKEIVIPSDITTIGNYAFYGCTGLTKAIYQGNAEDLTIGSNNTPLTNVLTYESLEYALDSNSTYYIVTGIGSCTSTEITVPATYEGTQVKEIGTGAFQNNNTLTSITLSDNVTTIESYAFDGCTSLANVSLSSAISYIGDYAFRNCTGLTSITIPNQTKTIGAGAFYGCTGLTSITIPNNITSISSDAFANCTGLTDIYIPYNEELMAGAPWGAPNATIHYKPTSGLSYSLNYGGTSYTVTGYDGYYSNVVIPSTYEGLPVTIIGGSAFKEKSIEKVIIPNSVTTITGSAFKECYWLTEITFGNSITSIGFDAFTDCTRLEKVYIDSLRSWLNIKFEDMSSNPVFLVGSILHIGNSLTSDTITEVVVPNDITSINLSTFANWYGLERVALGNNITSIGEDAFNGCRSLTSINIPDSVTSIGYSAFSGCSGLTSITIPDNVTTIEDSTFQLCENLTYITLGNNITSIGGYAFRGCTSLSSITIPNSVTSIGEYAFYECSLTSLIIPDNVTTIGAYAFDGCNLTGSLVIPDSVVTIGSYAFNTIPDITSLTIGNSVETIGQFNFVNVGVNELVIPASVKSIGMGSFGYGEITNLTIKGAPAIKEYAFRQISFSTVIILGNINAVDMTDAFWDARIQDLYVSTSYIKQLDTTTGQPWGTQYVENIHYNYTA